MQKAFWEASKWLQVGTLLALAQSETQMCFVEVVGRDIEHLKDLNTRARVEVRFLSSNDVERVFEALAACVAVNVNGRYVTAESHQAYLESQTRDSKLLKDVAVEVGDAVQISGNFGVARPVLEALQSARLAAPPFASTLFGGVHGEAELPTPLRHRHGSSARPLASGCGRSWRAWMPRNVLPLTRR